MALRSLFAVTPALRTSNSRAFSSIPRTAFRTGSNHACNAVSKKPFARPLSRFYATEPAPQKGSGSTVWLLLGLAVAAGGGYYFYTSSDDAETILKSGKQSAKAAAGFTPKFEDYQKVYNKIAGLLDEAGDYDGEARSALLFLFTHHDQMVLGDPFSFVSHGTQVGLTIKSRILVAGQFLFDHG